MDIAALSFAPEVPVAQECVAVHTGHGPALAFVISGKPNRHFTLLAGSEGEGSHLLVVDKEKSLCGVT